MSDAWYYEQDGKGVGPLPPDQLKAELLRRSDWRDRFVWRTGAKDWIKAGDIPELATIPPLIPTQHTTALSSVAPEELATAPPILPEEQATTPMPLVPDEPATAPPPVVPEPGITPPPVALKEPEILQFFYKTSGVLITPTLARFDNVTYPINGIGSVRVDPPRRWLALSFAVALGFFGYLVFLGDAKGEATSLAIILFACALLCLVWAFGKPYRLILGTASGDQRVFFSFKQQVLDEMKQAIEQAVIHRG